MRLCIFLQNGDATFSIFGLQLLVFLLCNKQFIAVELITHTFDITMAVFDVAQSVINRSGGLIQGAARIDPGNIAALQHRVETMEIGPCSGSFYRASWCSF